MKKLEDAVKVLEENTGVNFGELTWKDGIANLTEQHVKGIFTALFEELYLTVKESSGGDFKTWKFEFSYTHPGGGTNGRAIGTVWLQNGSFQYSMDRF